LCSLLQTMTLLFLGRQAACFVFAERASLQIAAMYEPLYEVSGWRQLARRCETLPVVRCFSVSSRGLGADFSWSCPFRLFRLSFLILPCYLLRHRLLSCAGAGLLTFYVMRNFSPRKMMRQRNKATRRRHHQVTSALAARRIFPSRLPSTIRDFWHNFRCSFSKGPDMKLFMETLHCSE
jgi:hypothetical protein